MESNAVLPSRDATEQAIFIHKEHITRKPARGKKNDSDLFWKWLRKYCFRLNFLIPSLSSTRTILLRAEEWQEQEWGV